MLRVAAVQMEPRLGELQANRDAIITRLHTAAAGGARLVVFPECALTGYCFDSRAEAYSCAVDVESSTLLAEISRECAQKGAHAVVGLLIKDGDRLYNGCALLGPGGVEATYRKVHLPYLGVDRFVDAGDRPFAVQEVAGVRIGMHICYDGSFPEVGRVLSLLGADLLVLPTNWPEAAETIALHVPACRAHENHVYAMAVNRVGTERGFLFVGRSSIHAPGGEPIAQAGTNVEVILYGEVDPSLSRNKRLVRVPGLHELNRIADRRPRFYSAIVEPNGKD